MKTLLIFKNGNVIFLLLLALSSCSDYLEVEPKDQVVNTVAWSQPSNADLFLNNIYAGLPNYTGEPLTNFSDDGVNGINQPTVSRTLYATSIHTPSDAPGNWTAMYTNIRKCNLFIENVTASELSESYKKQRLAEARFLRAYYYQLLWTWYGGVPIIVNVLDRNTQGEDIFVPRSTSEETYTFITDELAAIVDNLPLTAESGRATRGAALTLKGWVELFAASELKNPENNLTKWALAAATNKRVMDLGIYSLFPDYNTLLFEENNGNVEVIFAKKYLGSTALGNTKVAQNSPSFVNGVMVSTAYSNPSQELVDSYYMANGLPITDPSSGYDPQNPYLNREDRFYQSIVHDGSIWLGSEIVMKQGVGSANQTDISDQNEATNTGYYWRKGLDEQYATFGNNENSADHILFRYAEVLLNYAEAQNEASGPDATVYEAINKIRERSELPPLEEGLSQEEMRSKIRRERRIELAFESKRWYDLLRWRLAEKNLNGNLHAIMIEEENGVWNYETIPAPSGTRIFYADKNYLLPIPQEAMDRNSELTQNPGY